MRYQEKLSKRLEASGSALCVGIDPRPGATGISNLLEELRRLVGETAPYAAAFKPNMAYFEALGWRGLEVLENLLLEMPKEIPVVLDAKRSDIGETQRYYAQGYFDHWQVDAVTLNPFLGYDSIEPFLDWEGRGIYLLAVTSNAGSADFQRQKVGDRYLYELVQQLGVRAREEARATDVGLVVGLTNASEELLQRVDDVPLLIPGLGAQGGDLAGLAAQRRQAPNLINVSRGISVAEPERTYAAKAKDFAEQIARALAL